MIKVTKFPCTLKNTLPNTSNCSGLSFASKGLGYLPAPCLRLPLLACYKLPCYQTIYYLQFQCLQKLPCWKPLVISFCSSLGSTLLLIERTTIDPLYLWVINDILLIGNNIEFLESVKEYLNKSFSMKDLGEAAFILGSRSIEIDRDA